MNRVIKFRGLNAQGEFVYGLPSHDLPNSTSYYSEYSHRICWHLELREITNQPIKNGTLGQFTGLHDVNGVEIYESDLVTVPGIGVAEIKICPCYGVVYKANGAYGTCEVPYIDCAAENDYPTVIGNIYQNSDLLS